MIALLVAVVSAVTDVYCALTYQKGVSNNAEGQRNIIEEARFMREQMLMYRDQAHQLSEQVKALQTEKQEENNDVIDSRPSNIRDAGPETIPAADG